MLSICSEWALTGCAYEMSRQTNSIGVFSNKTILEVETKHTETVHIILAFQWSIGVIMIAYGFNENECFVSR